MDEDDTEDSVRLANLSVLETTWTLLMDFKFPGFNLSALAPANQPRSSTKKEFDPDAFN